MAVLGFIILFIIAGVLIGIFTESASSAIALIIIISILWAFAFGPWAIATLIELSVGYYIYKLTKQD